MKTHLTLLLSVAGASLACAGDAARSGGLSPLEILFITLGALILLGQFFPAMTLFASMLRGLFFSEDRRSDGPELPGKN